MRCCGNHLECIVQSWNFGAEQSDISSERSEKIKVWNAVVLNFNGWKNWVPKTVQFRLFLVIWSHSCMEFEEKNTYQYADVSVASNIRTKVLDVASVKSCVICYSAKSGWNSCCKREFQKKQTPVSAYKRDPWTFDTDWNLTFFSFEWQNSVTSGKI